VAFVLNSSQLIISFLPVTLLDQCVCGGGGWLIELTRIMSLQIWSSVGLGLTVISMILKRSEVLGLLPFVGLYGKPEIMCTLKIL
jgi:hypothetical protein